MYAKHTYIFHSQRVLYRKLVGWSHHNRLPHRPSFFHVHRPTINELDPLRVPRNSPRALVANHPRGVVHTILRQPGIVSNLLGHTNHRMARRTRLQMHPYIRTLHLINYLPVLRGGHPHPDKTIIHMEIQHAYL